MRKRANRDAEAAPFLKQLNAQLTPTFSSFQVTPQNKENKVEQVQARALRYQTRAAAQDNKSDDSLDSPRLFKLRDVKADEDLVTPPKNRKSKKAKVVNKVIILMKQALFYLTKFVDVLIIKLKCAIHSLF
jgi:hypothetical protein